MNILAVDIGTGTQDIYYFRAGTALENGFKMVMPSPTMIVRREIMQITHRRQALLLTGVMMGGGPSHWAVEAHLRERLPVYATPEAAQTFNDDLEWVQHEMGVRIVGDDEIHSLKSVAEVKFQDFDYGRILSAMKSFGINQIPQAVAVAVFDHGAAPPGVSDRQFRFDYMKARIQQENRLTTFAYRVQDVPSFMTRMLSVIASTGDLDCPLVIMDTAPAAILGATLDARLHDLDRFMITNIGNFHTLAFRIGSTGIEGLFEHHTGFLNQSTLDQLLASLADGSLTHQEVFDHQGHGALILHPTALSLRNQDFGVVVTGPRRRMMVGSALRPYFAVPFGDMMLTGCFGLLIAVAERLPGLSQPVYDAIAGVGAEIAPWDLET